MNTCSLEEAWGTSNQLDSSSDIMIGGNLLKCIPTQRKQQEENEEHEERKKREIQKEQQQPQNGTNYNSNYKPYNIDTMKRKKKTCSTRLDSVQDNCTDQLRFPISNTNHNAYNPTVVAKFNNGKQGGIQNILQNNYLKNTHSNSSAYNSSSLGNSGNQRDQDIVTLLKRVDSLLSAIEKNNETRNQQELQEEEEEEEEEEQQQQQQQQQQEAGKKRMNQFHKMRKTNHLNENNKLYQNENDDDTLQNITLHTILGTILGAIIIFLLELFIKIVIK